MEGCHSPKHQACNWCAPALVANEGLPGGRVMRGGWQFRELNEGIQGDLGWSSFDACAKALYERRI